MGNSKHNPYSAPLGNKLPVIPPPLSFSDTLVVPWPLLSYWASDPSLGAGVNRRAKNHEECKKHDSAPTSACQLDQMAIGPIQGPLKSMQIFVLISVALDLHLCTQMKVSFFFFSQKRDKVMFSFHREKGSTDTIFPALLLGQSI